MTGNAISRPGSFVIGEVGPGATITSFNGQVIVVQPNAPAQVVVLWPTPHLEPLLTSDIYAEDQ